MTAVRTRGSFLTAVLVAGLLVSGCTGGSASGSTAVTTMSSPALTGSAAETLPAGAAATGAPGAATLPAGSPATAEASTAPTTPFVTDPPVTSAGPAAFDPALAATGIGTLSGTPDRSAAKSATVTATSGTAVSVTDSSGATWRLSIPAGAVPAPVTITVVPLTGVSATGGHVHPTSGVAFEPDGMTFLAPLTLTVTENSPGPAPPLLLSADADGTHLRAALPPPDGTPAATNSTGSATILHFSRAGSDPAPSLDPAWAAANLDAALANADALLAESPSDGAPPRNPIDQCAHIGESSADASAQNRAATKSLNEFIEGEEMPEVESLAAAFSASAAADPAADLQERRAHLDTDVVALLQRILDRALAAVKALPTDSADAGVTQIPIVSTLVAGMAKAVLHPGTDSDTATMMAQLQLQPLYVAAMAKADAEIDAQITLVRTGHRYSAAATAAALSSLLRPVAAIGHQPDHSAEQGGRIARALGMTLSGTLKVHLAASQDGISTDGDFTVTYHAELTAPPGKDADPDKPILDDPKATGSYSGGVTISFGTTPAHGTETQRFTFETSSDSIDLCAASITVHLGQWGENPELWTVSGRAIPLTGDGVSDDPDSANQLANSVIDRGFASQLKSGSFAVHLDQGSPSGTWTGHGAWAAAGASGVATMTLTHHPG